MSNTVSQKVLSRVIRNSGSGILSFNLTASTLVIENIDLYSFVRTQVLGQVYGLYRFTKLRFTIAPAQSSYAFGVYTDEESGAVTSYLDVAELPSNIWMPATTTHARSLTVGKKLLNQTQVRWFETQDVSSGVVPVYVAMGSLAAAGTVYVYVEYDLEFCQPIPPNLSLFKRSNSDAGPETRFTANEILVTPEEAKLVEDYHEVRSQSGLSSAIPADNSSTKAVQPRRPPHFQVPRTLPPANVSAMLSSRVRNPDQQRGSDGN